MHLGMSGRFVVEAPGTPPVEPGAYYNEIGRHLAHDHVVFHLGGRARASPITTSAASASWTWCRAPNSRASRHFAGMGIEPLGNELSGETLARLFAGKIAPLKAALLDQRLVAGLGNIYVCEALFRAGLHPEAAGRQSIATADRPSAPGGASRWPPIIREVLEEAIAAGGSTLRDFAHADGSLGYFQHRFRVYDREGEPCTAPGCGIAGQAPRPVGPLDLLLRDLPAARLRRRARLGRDAVDAVVDQPPARGRTRPDEAVTDGRVRGRRARPPAPPSAAAGPRRR